MGVATRSEVHKIGYWHETFHCWFIYKEAGQDYIYLQIRSDTKKDYPSLFDITAAGHILAHETIEDGVREVREEIGINVSITELISLGVINYCVKRKELIDKELAHVYLFESKNSFDDFTLQKEEVSGIIKANFNEFHSLWKNDIDEINIEGFVIDELGNRVCFDENVGKDRFVPHEESYYDKVLSLIYSHLQSHERQYKFNSVQLVWASPNKG
ncbi:NUDIX hydrolase [Paenibacillus radicis (ex Xue et al. 2023)]|uniref:NUDIX domain-containing protein n=1 Tax=Paenibacillus radicis (ex Xue et al. 2023) TaxID=2972489 RepID=A0ABT1YJ92_9BACL|nr:NUDIX domain-containing protein [Paenibacillus radicis (ex Xue et al. 2023)]MCR8632040.1 NUDIX domain-containing protein [Paenibacillus radicis (ex Xue et al. 2023)]